MTKEQPEALATFGASARKNNKPHDQELAATPETSAKSGNLRAEEKDTADIIGGNATGDKAKVNAAIRSSCQNR